MRGIELRSGVCRPLSAVRCLRSAVCHPRSAVRRLPSFSRLCSLYATIGLWVWRLLLILMPGGLGRLGELLNRSVAQHPEVARKR
jgi:hypothetical protein